MSEKEFMLLDVDHKRRSRNQFLFKVLIIGFCVIIAFVVISLMISGNTIFDLKSPKYKHHNNTTPLPQCSRQYHYDFSLLTLRWPISVCANSQDCGKIKYETNKWLIHGLWPTFNNQSWPQFCCSHYNFKVKDLDQIINDLSNYWPNLISEDSNDSLWRHEWTKHGTCTKAKPLQYFNNTLIFYRMFPIFDWLKESDIMPTNDNKIDLKSFTKVINDKLGHRVVLHCKNDRVDEIRICINHTSTTGADVIDCTENTNCDNHFYYPKNV